MRYPCGRIGAEHPEPRITLCFGRFGRRDAGARQRGTDPEQRQRLFNLQELGESGALAAVEHTGIRVGEPRDLRAA
jgi:hypothetical protein